MEKCFLILSTLGLEFCQVSSPLCDQLNNGPGSALSSFCVIPASSEFLLSGITSQINLLQHDSSSQTLLRGEPSLSQNIYGKTICLNRIQSWLPKKEKNNNKPFFHWDTAVTVIKLRINKYIIKYPIIKCNIQHTKEFKVTSFITVYEWFSWLNGCFVLSRCKSC